MNPELFETTMKSLQEKLGEETVAKVADDLGILKTAQNTAIEERKALEEKVTTAEKAREEMQMANARLLQQIPVMNETNNFSRQEETDKPKEPFDYRSIFDNNGKIKSN